MTVLAYARWLAKRLLDCRYFRTYRRFKPFTMIAATPYVANLKIAMTIRDVPGAVVECGTWKGGMIAGIAHHLGRHREYWLFDSFEGLPSVETIDGDAAKQWQAETSGAHYHNNCTAAEADARSAMGFAGINAPHVVKGWFENTLTTAQFPDGIALLRIDADWYKSTKCVLDALFPHVRDRGVVIVDDYYTWEGCAKAVHEYLVINNRPERIACIGGVCVIRKLGATSEPLGAVKSE